MISGSIEQERGGVHLFYFIFYFSTLFLLNFAGTKFRDFRVLENSRKLIQAKKREREN